jgi:hypothetical protein
VEDSTGGAKGPLMVDKLDHFEMNFRGNREKPEHGSDNAEF